MTNKPTSDIIKQRKEKIKLLTNKDKLCLKYLLYKLKVSINGKINSLSFTIDRNFQRLISRIKKFGNFKIYLKDIRILFYLMNAYLLLTTLNNKQQQDNYNDYHHYPHLHYKLNKDRK